VKLTELEPQFIRVGAANAAGGVSLAHVDSFAEAQGIRFNCPRGEGHWVVVWFSGRGVPPHHDPDWAASGTGYDDLTLSPSVDCTGDGGCQWHGSVTGGSVT